MRTYMDYAINKKTFSFWAFFLSFGASSMIYSNDYSAIDQLHMELENGEHGYIDAFLVIKDNKTIIEEYYEVDYKELTKNKKIEQSQKMNKNYGSLATPQYNYYNPDWHPFYKNTNLHTIQSVSKSVTSALIGIAIEQGHIAVSYTHLTLPTTPYV